MVIVEHFCEIFEDFCFVAVKPVNVNTISVKYRILEPSFYVKYRILKPSFSVKYRILVHSFSVKYRILQEIVVSLQKNQNYDRQESIRVYSYRPARRA